MDLSLIGALECYMMTEMWVSFGWGYGLLPYGIKPIPEPILTDHQGSRVAFTWGQFHMFKVVIIDMDSNIIDIQDYRSISQGPVS